MLNGCRTTKIYCRENCPPGRRTKPQNRVHFESEAAARLAGYRACLVCRPDSGMAPWQPKHATVGAGLRHAGAAAIGEA